MPTYADMVYKSLLNEIMQDGVTLSTRNHEVISNITLDDCIFYGTPLVTFRKVAWKTAIKEMEWFFSGIERCPKDLLPWWDGQLNKFNELLFGYSWQFRHFGKNYNKPGFDQVKFILEGLRNNPNSRRLLMTVWNPEEMANITSHNDNENTPTCCHSIVVQFFVRQNRLCMSTYQRSADMLLGVPHNWIQSWAMLLYFAHHAGLQVGTMRWIFGDAHIYKEESHLKVVEIIREQSNSMDTPNAFLMYNPGESPEVDNKDVPIFNADHFSMVGTIPEPITTIRPKLL